LARFAYCSMHFLTRNIRVCVSRCAHVGGSFNGKICDVLTTPPELLRPWAALSVCASVCVLNFGIWIVTSGSWLRTHPSNAARLLHRITPAHPVIACQCNHFYCVCACVRVSLRLCAVCVVCWCCIGVSCEIARITTATKPIHGQRQTSIFSYSLAYTNTYIRASA